MLTFFAWTASISYGLGAIGVKILSRHGVTNPWFFNFYWNLFFLLITAPIALWYGASLPMSWLPVVGASIFYALGGTLFILALYKLDVSVLAPLFSIRIALSALLAALFLAELLSLYQYALIAMIFIFGMFVGIDERLSFKSFLNVGVAIALCDMLALALMGVFIKAAVAENGFWTTTLWMALLAQVLLLSTVPFFIRERIRISYNQYGIIAFIAITDVVATIAANAAYAINVSFTAAIVSLPVSMILAILLAYVVPNLIEKHTAKVYAIRIVSAAIMFAAALQL